MELFLGQLNFGHFFIRRYDVRPSSGRNIFDDVGFNPSTQRHYRRLIYYLYIHSYMFRSYDHHQAEKYITTLGLLNYYSA
jgi:hypothetical protein